MRKSPKVKRSKIEIVLDVDEETRHWVADVLRPTTYMNFDDVMPQDYTVEKTILSPTSRATYIKIWTVGNTRISRCIWKDQKDKQELKQSLCMMVEYIHTLQSPDTRALPNAISIIDVTSPTN